MFSQKKMTFKILRKPYQGISFFFLSIHPLIHGMRILFEYPAGTVRDPEKSSDSLSDNSVRNIDIHTEKCVNTCFEKIIQAQRERSLWVEVIQKMSLRRWSVALAGKGSI